jgi:hypothetical protein
VRGQPWTSVPGERSEDASPTRAVTRSQLPGSRSRGRRGAGAPPSGAKGP